MIGGVYRSWMSIFDYVLEYTMSLIRGSRDLS
jgi:hypothetical protein